MENTTNNIIVSLLELQTNFEHHFKINNQYKHYNTNDELINHYNELLTTTITNTINFINNKTKDETIEATNNDIKNEIKKYKHNNKVSLDTLNINYDQLSKLN
jgi:polyribonucleotide nucleotidyltransferase